MKRIIKSVLVAIFAIALSNCGSDGTGEVEISLIPYQDASSSMWGFIDADGEVVIKPQFNREPGFFKDGYSLIYSDSGYFNFIDISGALKGEKYKFATEFSEGLACVVEQDGAPKYIDRDLKEVFELKHAKDAGMFSEGLARFRDTSGYWGYVDKSGEVAIKPQFNSASNFSEGCAYVFIRKEGKAFNAVIDKKGEITARFDNMTETRKPFSEGLAATTKGGGWGYVDAKGNIAVPINPAWADATQFYNGYASVQEGNFWGVINTKGEYAIKPKYTFPLLFFSGLAMFDEKGKKGFIDEKGQVIIKPQFIEVALPFLSGFAIVRNDSGFIFIDKEGKKLNDKVFANVSRNYYKLKSLDGLVSSDFFDFKGIASAMLSSVAANEINGINNSMSSVDVMKLYNIKDKGIRENPFDTSLIISKTKELDYGLSLSTNIKFKAFQGHSRMITIGLSMRVPTSFFEKLPRLMNEIKDRFTKAGFSVKGSPNQYYFDCGKSWASVTPIGSRIEIEFNFKY